MKLIRSTFRLANFEILSHNKFATTAAVLMPISRTDGIYNWKVLPSSRDSSLQIHLGRSYEMVSTDKGKSGGKRTYGRDRVEASSARTWTLLPSVLRPVFASHVEGIPPGAVGGRYGSGCFHFSSRFLVSAMSA